MPWPKQVPVLTAENISRTYVGYRHECMDVATWFCQLFGTGSKEWMQAVNTLYQVAEHIRSPEEAKGYLATLVLFGTEKRNSPRVIAEAMNACFYELGYEVYEWV